MVFQLIFQQSPSRCSITICLGSPWLTLSYLKLLLSEFILFYRLKSRFCKQGSLCFEYTRHPGRSCGTCGCKGFLGFYPHCLYSAGRSGTTASLQASPLLRPRAYKPKNGRCCAGSEKARAQHSTAYRISSFFWQRTSQQTWLPKGSQRWWIRPRYKSRKWRSTLIFVTLSR